MLIIMKKLIILRMFFCFPLFGMLLPDAGTLLSKNPARVPLTHVIIEVSMLFCILLCTAAIFYGKKRIQNHADKANEASYF